MFNKDKINKKIINNNLKKLLFIFYLSTFILFYILFLENNSKNDNYQISKRKDYINTKFAVIKRNCDVCGLFSNYITNLGFIHKYLLEGYIPIFDIKSFPNTINGFNTSKENYWDIFFFQPFGYTLEEVLKHAKNITNITIYDCSPRPDRLIFENLSVQNFWHNLANKYSPVKKEIINLTQKIKNKLFKGSKNILGVLTRGTDYISRRPPGHHIPPNVTDLIKDVKLFDSKYKYDYIFLSTEDENIRDKFTGFFGNKVKQIKPQKFHYDYIKNDFVNLSFYFI